MKSKRNFMYEYVNSSYFTTILVNNEIGYSDEAWITPERLKLQFTVIKFCSII